MRLRCFLFLLLVLLAGSSCSRDPKVVRQKYLQNGNRYFEKGKYKEARIMYLNALRKDARYGEAYYRLGLTQLRMGQRSWLDAVRSLRRAVELEKGNLDAKVQLANILMLFYLGDPRKPAVIRTEIEDLYKQLLDKDPNSVQGLRLRGDLLLRADNNFKEAIATLGKADAVSPGQPEVVLPLVQSLLGDNQTQEAEKLARSLIDKQNSLAPAYDLLYLFYLRNNRLEDAEGILKAKVANNPKRPDFLLQLAVHYYTVKRQPDMEGALQKLTANSKDFPGARRAVGDFYSRIRDYDSAIRQYQQGLRDDPKQKAIYQKRIAEALVAQGKRTEATRLLEEILKESPQDDQATAMRAALLIDTANPQQVQTAINELQSVVGRMPKNAVLRFDLGRALAAKGQLEQARTQFQESVKIAPGYLLPRLALAQLHLYRREFPASLQAAQDILQMEPRNLPAKLLRNSALIEMNNFSQARLDILATLKDHPNSTDVVYQLAKLSLSERKYKDAEDLFSKLYQGGAGDMRGLMGLSETYAAQKNYDKSVQLLKTQLAKNPERSDMRWALANMEVRSAQYDQAIADFQWLLQKNPNSPDLYNSLGQTYRLKGDMKGAIDNIRKAKDLKPNEPGLWLTLGLLLDSTGQSAEARASYEQVLKLDPDNPIALNNLAYRIAETGGDLDQALTLAQRAKQKLPQDLDVADTLGWIYIKKNLSDNAIEIFRDLVGKNPANPTYRYHLGMAFYQKGDKPQAKRELLAALQRKPSKEEEQKIKELLGKVS